jgi:transposase InsO family protein
MNLFRSRFYTVWADSGRYIASESTFHRVLRAESMLQHQGAEKPKNPRSRPRASHATAPNQLFGWDITYLPTEIKGVYFYLYVFV